MYAYDYDAVTAEHFDLALELLMGGEADTFGQALTLAAELLPDMAQYAARWNADAAVNAEHTPCTK